MGSYAAALSQLQHQSKAPASPHLQRGPHVLIVFDPQPLQQPKRGLQLGAALLDGGGGALVHKPRILSAGGAAVAAAVAGGRTVTLGRAGSGAG